MKRHNLSAAILLAVSLGSFQAHSASEPLEVGITYQWQGGETEWLPYFDIEKMTDYGLLYAQATEFGVAFPLWSPLFTSVAVSPMFAEQHVISGGRHQRNETLSAGAVWRLGVTLNDDGYLSTGILYDVSETQDPEWFIDNSVPMLPDMSLNTWLRYKSERVYDKDQHIRKRQSGIREMGISIEQQFTVTERWNAYVEFGAVYEGFEYHTTEGMLKLTLTHQF